MQKFEFKPALLKGKEIYHLKGQVLCLTGKSGWEISLADVERAGLVDQKVKGQRMSRLDLFVGGQRHSMALNQAALGWRESPDAVGFLALLKAVAEGLLVANPSLEVSLGEYGKFRVWMFVMGLISALSGVAILLTALAIGVDNTSVITAIVPVIVLIGFGSLTSRAYWPWTKLPQVRVAELPKVLAFLESGDQG